MGHRVHNLGGRMFEPAEITTSRHDGWLMAQCEDAGILALTANGVPSEDATRAATVQAIRADKFHLILAALLVEADVKWTPAVAAQNAEFFADLTDPEQKKLLWDVFAGLLKSFFELAGKLSTRSENASTTAPESSETSPATNATPSTDPPAASGPSVPDGSLTATVTA